MPPVPVETAMDEAMREAHALLRRLRQRSLGDEVHGHELTASRYTLHEPGVYTAALAYRDCPVVEASDTAGALVVELWLDRADASVERLDDRAWALFVD